MAVNQERTLSTGVLIVAAIVVASLGAGTIYSYLRTVRSEITRVVLEQTPVEFDLQRLKVSADDLLPQINSRRQAVARLGLTIDGFRSQLGNLENQTATARAEMERLRRDLATSEAQFQYSGRSFTRAEVASDLSNRMDAFECLKSELAEKRKDIEGLTSMLTKATTALGLLTQRRGRLLARYEKLKARLLVSDVEGAALGNQDLNRSVAAAEDLAREVDAKVSLFQSSRDLELIGWIPVDPETSAPEARYDQLFGKGPH
jgi:chromosome segregation ATPase